MRDDKKIAYKKTIFLPITVGYVGDKDAVRWR